VARVTVTTNDGEVVEIFYDFPEDETDESELPVPGAPGSVWAIFGMELRTYVEQARQKEVKPATG
jgi:hypothetical protein